MRKRENRVKKFITMSCHFMTCMMILGSLILPLSGDEDEDFGWIAEVNSVEIDLRQI